MSADKPKQYLSLQGQTVLEHTLKKFLKEPWIKKIVVVIAKDDPYWPQISLAKHPRIMTVVGGDERYLSVLNGLHALQAQAQAQDWIMVHDAARPCIRSDEINNLINALQDHSVGGLLAIPVRDTLKKSTAAGEVVATVDREYLWQAQTPQIFRYNLLLTALEKAIEKKLPITDESMAIESLGLKPLIVPGSSTNIKITYPDDLNLMREI